MFLLVGGDSEIGAATRRYLTAQGQAVAATTRRPDRASAECPWLDLAAPLDDWEPPSGTQSVCILAAIARLADCAGDPAGSAHINVTQTLILIERLIARGIYVLFLSTNQVFDGETPNVPADAPVSPVSEYGRQKVRVETVLCEHMQRGAPAAILRLAKVVSASMPLIEGWTKALRAGEPVRGFHDMTLAPTPTEMVCAAIDGLLEDRAAGIYQLTGPRDVAYVEVARFIAAHLDADPALVTATSALSSGLPLGATPRHTTLDSSALRERYGLEVPDVWALIEPMITAAKI
jgi:dTDP-4-dehydrorhamnose reductase